MVGLSNGHPDCTNVPVYQTEDIAATVALVREVGGRLLAPR